MGNGVICVVWVVLKENLFVIYIMAKQSLIVYLLTVQT